MREWSLDDLADDAELLASEMLTNAVQATSLAAKPWPADPAAAGTTLTAWLSRSTTTALSIRHRGGSVTRQRAAGALSWSRRWLTPGITTGSTQASKSSGPSCAFPNTDGELAAGRLTTE